MENLTTMLLLALLSISFACSGHATVISRPNVGVVFSQEQDMPIPPTIWHHTLAIPFKLTSSWTPPLALCNNSNTDICRVIQNLHSLYSEAILRVHDQIASTEMNIIHMAELTKSTRQKRGLFDFIGKGAKSLFGLATNEDLKVLAQHILKLQNMVDTNNNDRVTDVTKLHSYQVKASERMDDLSNHLVQIDTILVNMSSQFDDFRFMMKEFVSYTDMIARHSHLFNDTYQVFQWLSHYNVRLISLTETYNVLQALMHDIPHLLDGKLTPNILHSKTLSDILIKVDDQLRQFNSVYHVACDFSYFYRNEYTLVATMYNSTLYLKLNIPIHASFSHFLLYSVNVFPTPADAENPVYTMVSEVQPYLMLTPDNATYLELNTDQKSKLTSYPKFFTILPNSVTNTSCILNIFFLRHDLVSETCKIELLHNPQFPPNFVYHLPDQNYLIYSPTTTWLLKCPNKRDKQLRHAGLFTVSLACRCMLHSPLSVFMAVNVECDESLNSVSFSSNFLVYASLYHTSLNLSLRLTELSPEPLHFQLPSKLVNHATLKALERKDKSRYASALHLFNASATDASSSLTQFLDLFSVSSSTSILTITSSILIVLNILFIVALIALFIKVRQLQMVLAAVSTIAPAQGLTFTLPTPTDISFPAISINLSTSDKILLVLIPIFLCLIGILVLLFRLRSLLISKFSPSGSLGCQLFLTFWSTQDSLCIPLVALPVHFVPDMLTFDLNLNETKLHLLSFNPILLMEWSHSTHTTPLGDFGLPKRCQLSYVAAFRLRKMLSFNHVVHLTLATHSSTTLLLEWYQESGVYCRSVTVKPTAPFGPTLYPQLPQSSHATTQTPSGTTPVTSASSPPHINVSIN